jgi:flagellar motility protein MotE (MotC chaperone)
VSDIVERLAVYANPHGIHNPRRTRQDRECEEAMAAIIDLRRQLREQMDGRERALDRCDRLLAKLESLTVERWKEVQGAWVEGYRKGAGAP